jgi:hypothetical protein
MTYSVIQNLISKHTGKWFEVITFCKTSDDDGTIMAKFIHGADALAYANKLVELSNNNLYTLIVVR